MNVGTFHSVLHTYQQTAKNLASEVLHATFFMPSCDADILQTIAGGIDYLHQMLGHQNDESLILKCVKSIRNREAALHYDFPPRVARIVIMSGTESALFENALGKTQLFSSPALSANDFVLLLFRQVC